MLQTQIRWFFDVAEAWDYWSKIRNQRYTYRTCLHGFAQLANEWKVYLCPRYGALVRVPQREKELSHRTTRYTCTIQYRNNAHKYYEHVVPLGHRCASRCVGPAINCTIVSSYVASGRVWWMRSEPLDKGVLGKTPRYTDRNGCLKFHFRLSGQRRRCNFHISGRMHGVNAKIELWCGGKKRFSTSLRLSGFWWSLS